MNIKKIVIFCNANEDEGMGHFFRCLYYSRFLNNKDTRVCFLGKYNELAKAAIIDYGCQSKAGNFQTLINFEGPVDYLLVDTYLLTQAQIDILCKKYRTIFVDDFGIPDYKNAYAVINFTIHAPFYEYKAKYNLLGPHFFPYKKGFLPIRENNLKNRRGLSKENNNILVFFSGKSLEENKVKSFIKTIDSFYVNGLITLIFNQEFSEFVIRNNRFEHFKIIEQIENLYRNTTLIFSGGGLVKYEAAFCAIPNFSFAITELQQAETIQFERQHLTMNAGTYYDFNLDELAKKISHFHQDLSASEQFYKNTEAYFRPEVLEEKLSHLFGNNYGHKKAL